MSEPKIELCPFCCGNGMSATGITVCGVCRGTGETTFAKINDQFTEAAKARGYKLHPKLVEGVG